MCTGGVVKYALDTVVFAFLEELFEGAAPPWALSLGVAAVSAAERFLCASH